MKNAIALLAGCALIIASSAFGVVVYDVGGWEGYALGDLPGQFGWEEDTDGGYPMAQIVADPTGSGMGNVLELDPPGNSGGWQGVAIAFGPTTAPIVTIEWDQWRADVGDNIWYADNKDFGRFWAMQWDQNGGAFARQFNGAVALTPGQWQHISYTLDFTTGVASVDVDGAVNTDAALGAGEGPLRGWVFEMEPTAVAGDGPAYIDNLVVTEVPEPGLLALLAVGLGWIRRRR